MPKRRHMGGRLQRHLGEIGGARIRIDMGIGQEIDALRGDDGGEGCKDAHAGREPDDVADMGQVTL